MRTMYRCLVLATLASVAMVNLTSEALARCRDQRMTCRFINKCRTVNDVIPREIDRCVAAGSDNCVGAALNDCANFGGRSNSVTQDGRNFDDFAAGCDNYVQLARGISNCNQFPE